MNEDCLICQSRPVYDARVCRECYDDLAECYERMRELAREANERATRER